MYFVISVINPNGLSILNNICQRLEIPVILSLIGHGTASQKIRDLWGIESTDKRILFAVADENKTKSLITEERRRLYIDAPGNGIVISVPIKSVGGGSTLNFLNGGNKDMKAPEGPVLRIPVVLAASFEGGKFTAKNGLLSNKASNGQSVKDLSGATLTAYKLSLIHISEPTRPY